MKGNSIFYDTNLLIMKSFINLALSRKQCIMLFLVVENCVSFLNSFSDLDVNCNIKGLVSLRDFLNDSLK